MFPSPIQIRQLRLNLPAAEIELLAQTLSPDETARALRFRADCDRNRFIAARGQLREILGQELHCHPREIAFGYAACGKPFLHNDTSGLRFNLSHADDIALVALAWNRAVGVDIERVRTGIDVSTLAARFLPPDERHDDFFRAWVRREAYLKALGVGFTAPFDTPPLDPALWYCQDLEVGPDHRAAFVVEKACGDLPPIVVQSLWEANHEYHDKP